MSITDDGGGNGDENSSASTDAGALLRTHGVDALDAGLFKCSAAVFDHLEELATQLPHFSAMQVFQKVAAQGRLIAMSTGGLQWFAVDRPETLEAHAARLVRLIPTLSSMRGSSALRSTAVQDGSAASSRTEPGTKSSSRPRVVKSNLGTSGCIRTDDSLLSATCPAKQRFYICPVGWAGEVIGPVAFLSGGGGMLSTAHDYARFAQMLLNHGEIDGRRILSRKTMQYMVRNQLPLDS